LLASVKSATKAADEAVLLADRALFLAERLPFFVRHQIRLGRREIVGDTLQLLGSPDALLDSVKSLQPIIAELLVLQVRWAEAAHESRLLLQELKSLMPTLEQVARLKSTLECANRLMKTASARIGDVRTSMTEGGAGRFLQRVARRVGAMMRSEARA
jgi:hypothetical protein